MRWQIKGCQTTEPRTFDSGFSGKVNLSTLGFNGTPTYLLTTLCVPSKVRVSPLCMTKLDTPSLTRRSSFCRVRPETQDYLGGQDKQLCKNCPDRKPSLFHSTDFITFDSDGTCKYLKNKRISKIDIYEKRNIFIPIHKGHHFTCVVIFLDKKQIN